MNKTGVETWRAVSKSVVACEDTGNGKSSPVKAEFDGTLIPLAICFLPALFLGSFAQKVSWL